MGPESKIWITGLLRCKGAACFHSDRFFPSRSLALPLTSDPQDFLFPLNTWGQWRRALPRQQSRTAHFSSWISRLILDRTTTYASVITPAHGELGHYSNQAAGAESRGCKRSRQ